MKIRYVLFALAATGCATEGSDVSIDVDDPSTADEPTTSTNPTDVDPNDVSFSLPGSPSNCGRAYGIKVIAAGINPVVAATPDTLVENPSNVHDSSAGVASDTVFGVGAVGGSSQCEALALANWFEIDVGGVTLSASAISARAKATASGGTITKSNAGTFVADLVLDGESLGTLTTPQTFALPNSMGQVWVLRTVTTTNGLTVEGIRIRINDNPLTPVVNETTEIVVSFASAYATGGAG